MSTNVYVAAVMKIRDAWPRPEFSEGEARLYGEELARFPADLVAAAVNDIVRTGGAWRPSVPQVIEAVAERALALPTVEEAWEIACRGSLSSAAAEVRRACEHVGGRWTILHTTNPETVRAQFRQAYKGYRQAALNDYATGGRPGLNGEPMPGLEGPTMAALPVSDRVRPRPVQARWLSRAVMHEEPGPPTEEEKHDAILILQDGPNGDPEGDPTSDLLYVEAERVFVDGAA